MLEIWVQRPQVDLYLLIGVHWLGGEWLEWRGGGVYAAVFYADWFFYGSN